MFLAHLEGINDLEEYLKGSTLWKREFKLHVNKLLKLSNDSINELFKGLNSDEIKTITQQYMDLAKMVNHWMTLVIIITLKKPMALVELNNQIILLFKKFGGDEVKEYIENDIEL